VPSNVLWHAQEHSQVMDVLGSSPEGLTDDEAAIRLSKYGPNEIRMQKRASTAIIFLKQFKNVLICLLIIALLISMAIGEYLDACIIGAVILLNALLGTYQELQAERSIESLRKYLVREALVIRSGEKRKVASSSLVPGDIMEVEAGDYVPADARVITSSNFTVDESTLTGESEPVFKNASPAAIDAQIGDQGSMIFGGTIASAGRCRAIVVRTGMDSEIGRIAALAVSEIKRETPVQISLNKLGSLFGAAAICVCLMIFIGGIMEGRAPFDMFLVSVSLAVAAIPEGLPATVTIIFSLGVQRMAGHNAIIRKLAAVETLGSTSVICSDKTGTLTQNKIVVKELLTASKSVTISDGEKLDLSGNTELQTLLLAGVLCNNATYEKTGNIIKALGDSTEVALLAAGEKANIKKNEIEARCPRHHEFPFDSSTMFMMTINRCADGEYSFAKGAPERVLDRCTHYLTDDRIKPLTNDVRQFFIKANVTMAATGMRVLGMGYKRVDEIPFETMAGLGNDLIFIGLIGMIDPPRQEAKRAIDLCKRSGIDVIMITGDQLMTAVSIARALSIYADGDRAITGTDLAGMSDEALDQQVTQIKVYARTTPEQKLRIVKALQRQNLVVAMTGDGVNDAPALKTSDIGVSMGLAGTEVARQASDMVLADDNFATIVSAVEEGRTIYENVRKAVKFLFSSNLGEVMTIFMGILLALPLPLLAIQILWINLVTDSLPAIALGMDPPDRAVMNRPPRPRSEGIITRIMALDMAIIGLVVSIGTLGLFYVYLGHGIAYARTIAFLALIMFQMWNVLNCKSSGGSVISRGTLNNVWLLAAIAVSILLQLILIYLPPFHVIFDTTSIDIDDLIIVFAVSFTVVVVIEARKAIIAMSKIYNNIFFI